MNLLTHQYYVCFKIALLCFATLLALAIGACDGSEKATETQHMPESPKKPNVVFIFADDLGFGDVGYYNSLSRIPTPNIDQLAKEGLAFSDAHSPAPICGPSRYGLLTGRYSWRNPGGTGNGHDYDPIKIEAGRLTLASLFQELGYNTAQIGKWGLRYNYGEALKNASIDKDAITPESFDYSKPILGPNLRGFDYAFTAVTLSGGNKRTAPGVGKWYFENGLPYQGSKPRPENFDYSKDLKITSDRVVDYIRNYSAPDSNDAAFNLNREKPFFIYFDTISPHLPYAPQKDFKGKSKAGEFGDLMAELDFRVGEIVTALKEANLYENTILIFTSDNGPEQNAYERIRRYDHYSMGPWRGVKTHMWEGGTRVPFIIRGPGIVGAGRWVDEPIILTDVISTFSEMFEYDISGHAAEDSNSFLPLLKNMPGNFSPSPIIYQSIRGDLAIRDGDWVLINAPSGAAGGRREPQWFRDLIGAQPHESARELFNLRTDPQEKENLYASQPDVAERLLRELKAIEAGADQRKD
ncbi:sulfatase family protein [Hyphococcus sp.]|uniref:sulfatase family protein n=1 Tax=Hyphococcus sp. TaxID=2038636 RepID=UPI00207ECCCF|nr:MAG: arylsulfatase [Marinicaulis sp.]